MQQDSEGLSLERALDAVRRRAPLIVLCLVLAAGAAFGFSKHQTKKYTATASLAFSSNPLSQQIAGLSTGSSSSSLLAQQASDLELVRLGDMAAKTASLLGHGLTEEKVASSLSIAGQGESGVVDVSATATSPVLAAAIANTYTSQFVKEQQSANRQYFKSALALVNKQLAATLPAAEVRRGWADTPKSCADAETPLGTEVRQRPGRSGSAAAYQPLLAKDIEKHGSWAAAGPAHRPRSCLRARATGPPDQGTGGTGGDLSPADARRRPRERALSRSGGGVRAGGRSCRPPRPRRSA